ncbi:MAG: bifunctional riboflavin kinase/FAD synthetase [Desulfobacterota bacterium]|nr:bifunctional riboflavin kinase/FAD synthetase [Thermodesulfobacteriota bacterium]
MKARWREPNRPMEIINGSSKVKAFKLTNPVITVGNFDGVHLGHQKILKKTIQRAHALGGCSLVYTFHPHPLQVLRPEDAPPAITTFEEKVAIIGSIGIDYLVCEHFTRQYAEQPPEEFIKNIICDRIHPREIIIGHDYAFGKNRKGTVELLRKMGEIFHFKVHVIDNITIKNIPVRSTTVRRLIVLGKVSLAEKLLGRSYCLSGKVIHGKQRRIGFPTANLSPGKSLIPKNGVYAIRAATPYGVFNGVVNIGFNPTFAAEKLTIEAHLFDFSADLYGKELSLHFIKRIRGEKKFPDVDALVKQIEKDIALAKRILAAHRQRQEDV